VKIALVIFHADPARGGAERYTIDMADALRSRGHVVTLIASSFAKQLPPDVEQVEIASSSRSRTWRYVEFLDQLDAHLQAHAYDIVHAMLPVRKCDVYHPHAGLAVASIEEGHQKHIGIARPVAKVLNQFNRKRQRFVTVERRLLEATDRPLVISLSNYVGRAVREYYPWLGEADLATLFNAVDLARFDPAACPQARADKRKKLGLDDSHIVALMIAQDFARKGLREAIEAMAGVQEKQLHLVVVGKQRATSYQALAQRRGIAPRVHFAGETSDVYAFYAAADFFVLPTRHDPCSLVVLEALAMGLPVISTRQNGATEAMEHGVDGCILDSADSVDDLELAMERLCHAAERKQMSEACIARRGRLSFDRHIEALEEIYRRAQARK
jgi:UDP-glucose:(heptosyl)LPS alpha-1,3-glucosyltransferase